MKAEYQPKTGEACHCKPGQQRDNCPDCEGTGQRIDFAKIRARTAEHAPMNVGGAFLSLRLQPETISAMLKINAGTVAERTMQLGISNAEPLLIAMDGLLRYAKAYARRFEGELSGDYVLGPEWLNAAKAIRALLNGDGAVAMEKGVTTDSKDNGVIETVFWAALGIAGFTDADL